MALDIALKLGPLADICDRSKLAYNKTANSLYMLKTYQFKTQCKGDIHNSKTANIILPGLVREYRPR